MSKIHDKKIKQYKNDDVEKKKHVVNKIKNEKCTFLVSIHQSRILK